MNFYVMCHDRVTSLWGSGSQRSLRRPRKFGTRMIRKKFHKIFEFFVEKRNPEISRNRFKEYFTH